jgi:hypothetical protein
VDRILQESLVERADAVVASDSAFLFFAILDVIPLFFLGLQYKESMNKVDVETAIGKVAYPNPSPNPGVPEVRSWPASLAFRCLRTLLFFSTLIH